IAAREPICPPPGRATFKGMRSKLRKTFKNRSEGRSVPGTRGPAIRSMDLDLLPGGGGWQSANMSEGCGIINEIRKKYQAWTEGRPGIHETLDTSGERATASVAAA